MSIGRRDASTMKEVTRRFLVVSAGLSWFSRTLWAAAPGVSVRGKLTRSADGKPALEAKPRKLIYLEGDADTLGVLNDKRISGTDFEALGHFQSADHFEIDGIHERAMFVYKNGKRLLITYWCDVCYIRTYTPGVCVCCQKYTDLDLRESEES